MTDRSDETRPLPELGADDTAPLDVEEVSRARCGPARDHGRSGVSRLTAVRRWWQDDPTRRKRVLAAATGGTMLVLAALLFSSSATGPSADDAGVAAPVPVTASPTVPASPTGPAPESSTATDRPSPTPAAPETTATQQANAYRITDAIIGLDADAVADALREAGFTVERQVRDSDQPSGTVIGVDPPIGSHVRPGDRILLIVAS